MGAAVGVYVGIGVLVAVAVAVGVGIGVLVAVGVGVDVAVGACVGVGVLVAVGGTVDVADRVGDAVSDGLNACSVTLAHAPSNRDTTKDRLRTPIRNRVTRALQFRQKSTRCTMLRGHRA